ncbi:MAG: hypothetical protein ACK463_15895, partial [Bradyrhizobium sp.]
NDVTLRVRLNATLAHSAGQRSGHGSMPSATSAAANPAAAPIVGWVADHLGPRWALGVGAAAGFAAALVALGMLSRANAAAGQRSGHGSMPPAE